MNQTKFGVWRKSSYSGGNGNCVEVASTETVVGIRDSKQRGHGAILTFSRAEWDAFISAIKDGEFDR